MNPTIARVEIKDEADVLQARYLARFVAERLGFAYQDRLAIASAATLVGFNALNGSARGHLLLNLTDAPAPSLSLDWVTESTPQQPASSAVVVHRQSLPGSVLPLDPEHAARLVSDCLAQRDGSQIRLLLDQDGDLFELLKQADRERKNSRRLKAELDEARQAILTLHEELAERSLGIQDAHELKNRFLSRISHELRTPLAAILGLGRLLLDRADGELATEQERQVSFILGAARELSTLVNNLLEFARMEAGLERSHFDEVSIPVLFQSLRGMFQPLLPPEESAVGLVIEEPTNLTTLRTDGVKLGRILRHLLSNALKFTTRGEVRLTARRQGDDWVVFSVTDSGRGIPSELIADVFEEFTRVEDDRRPQVSGIGLGLTLANRLAAMLGGQLEVQSQPGKGSTFVLTLPAARPHETNPNPATAPDSSAESAEAQPWSSRRSANQATS